VLGERIERNLYDLLETLIQARYTRDRQGLLRQANLTLEVLRFHQGAKSRSPPCVAPSSDGPAEGSVWPRGSGRPHGSKAPPGRVVEGAGLDQHANRHRRPVASVGEVARLAG